MLTGLIGLFTQDPKQKLADEFIKFVETGNAELLKDYKIQIGSKEFYQGGKGYINFTLRNKITKEKEYFSVGITPFLCNQESGNYVQELACIRMKQNSKHKNIKTYESSSIMFPNIQQLISNITSSENSRFQDMSDFAERYLSNSTSTKLFDFGAAKQLEKSTTEGISHTTQEIREYNDEYTYPLQAPTMQQIADGAFKIGNGTATWNSGLVNDTRAELPVFNGTDVSEPTAIPAVEAQAAGMSTAAIAGLAGLGVLVAAVVGFVCHYRKNKVGVYDVEATAKKAKNGERFTNDGLETRSPLLPKSDNQEQAVPKSLEPTHEERNPDSHSQSLSVSRVSLSDRSDKGPI